MMKTVKKLFAILLVTVMLLTNFLNLPILSDTNAFGITVSAASAKKSTVSMGSSVVYVGGSVKLKLAENSGSVTWSTSNKNVAKVSSKGVVTGLKKGSATIAATSSKKVYKYSVSVKNVSLSASKLTLKYGKTSVLKLNGSAIKSVKSSNTSVATVNKSGKVTAKKCGTATISVVGANGKTYKCAVTVKPYISNTSLNILKGQTKTIKLYGVAVKSIKSSKSSVASVTKSGKITAKKYGSATITVVDANNKKYTCKVVVPSPKLNKKTLTLNSKKTYQLKVENSYKNKIKWSSGNKNIATVNSNGKITAKNAGTTTITCKLSDGKTLSCKVVVKACLNYTKLTLAKSDSKTLTLNGAKAKSIKSSKTSVATVSKSGKIVAKGKGAATITVTDTKNKKYTCKVSVETPKLNKTKLTINAKKSYTLKLSGNSQSITWSSSNKNVATVNKNGVVVAKSKGTATIKAKVKSGKTYSCSVTVKSCISNSSLKLAKGDYKTIAIYGSKIKSVKSSKTSVATISKSGKIVAKGKGTATITITDTSKTAHTCKVVVEAPSLSLTKLSIENGSTYTLKLNGNTQKVTWSTSNKSIAKVTSSGKITALKNGSVTITAKVASGKKYTCKVTVITTYYTVEFDSNGGSAVDSQTVRIGKLATQPEAPQKDGHNFAGWYIDGEYTAQFDFSTPITGKVTLYAKWTPIVNGTASGEDTSVSVYSISSLSVDPETGIVTATVSAPENCAIIVRFAEEDVYFSDNFATNSTYIDNGETFASHIVAANSDMTTITATVNNTLPENFVAVAVLIDENNTPLCDPYSSIQHTERYETFDNKTVYDFETEDVILNFDPNLNDNFGVLADDVKVILADDIDMVDVDGDGAEDVYQIKKPSETINENEKLFVQDEDESYLFKVGSLSIEQSIITIVPMRADDAENGFNMEDFYKFLKVEMSYDDEPSENADEQAQVPMLYSRRQTRGIQIYNVYENVSGSTALSVEPLTFETDHFKATAKLSGTISAKLLFEWDVVLFGEDYMRCDFEYTVDTKVTADVVAKWEDEEEEPEKEKRELKFGKVRIPVGVVGINAFVDLKLKVDWEITAGVHAEIVSKNTSGFKYNTVDGFQKIEKKENSWTVDCRGHAEVKIGLAPAVGVEFMDGVLSCSLECFFGGVIEGDAVIPVASLGDSKHACYLCVEGNVKLEISVSAKLSYKITDHLKGTPINWNIITVQKPLLEFYVSLLNDANSPFQGRIHAGLDGCPNKSYKTTIYANDVNNQSVETVVSIYNKDSNALVTTLTSGQNCYLYSGNYVAKATIEGISCEKTFTITSGAKTVHVNAGATDGQINGSVVDKITNTGLADVTIKVYEYTTCVATTSTSADGTYSISLDNGTYKLEASKDDYITATQYFTLRDGENKHLETMTLAQTDEDRIMGGIFGTIKDGVTGQTVSDVDVKISRGWGNENATNTYVAELKTDNYGEYSHRKTTILGIDFGLDAGNYTITISKDGYISTSFNVTVVGGEDLEFNSSITPVGAENVWHIVLTWGETPLDLDSHFNATYDGYRDHIYYSNQYGYASNLDVDDTTSYGPETITIVDATQYTGNMMYSVHDYSNRYYDDSTAMSMSGAVVKVYRGGVLLETFYVPSNTSGTVWNVFYIDEYNVIRPVNTFSSTSSPSEVTGSVE